MGKRRTAEQITRLLREADRDLAKGLTVADVCRKLGISQNAYYRWRQQHDPSRVDEARRVRELQGEVVHGDDDIEARPHVLRRKKIAEGGLVGRLGEPALIEVLGIVVQALGQIVTQQARQLARRTLRKPAPALQNQAPPTDRLPNRPGHRTSPATAGPCPGNRCS